MPAYKLACQPALKGEGEGRKMGEREPQTVQQPGDILNQPTGSSTQNSCGEVPCGAEAPGTIALSLSGIGLGLPEENMASA